METYKEHQKAIGMEDIRPTRGSGLVHMIWSQLKNDRGEDNLVSIDASGKPYEPGFKTRQASLVHIRSQGLEDPRGETTHEVDFRKPSRTRQTAHDQTLYSFRRHAFTPIRNRNGAVEHIYCGNF
jgi:hypothetical protein